ncbi:DMT family transporter [Niveispirillum sp. KHB5.9]|uniref:DMT family transporter n=1 Tax=Niveispirillum sp. KHB5.9 TaxID=3400269 RepID=UPI003A8A51F9
MVTITARPKAQQGEESFPAGIALAFVAFALYSGMDVTIKLLTKNYAVPQIIALNSLFALGPILAYAALFGGLYNNLRTRRPIYHVIRATCGLFSSFFAFWAYSRMPIADAYALAFTAPLFITALAVPILKEPVGWRRWSAIGVGFIGVLIMLRPGSGLINTGSLAVLAGALFYSVGMLVTRRARNTETSVSFAFYATLASGTVFGAMTPWLGRMPTLHDLGLSAIGGTLCGVAFVCLLTSFRKVPAAVAAPFQYSQIIWGVLFGWLVFGDVPDRTLFIGLAIVISSGLYILYRETVLGRQVTAATKRDCA